MARIMRVYRLAPAALGLSLSLALSAGCGDGGNSESSGGAPDPFASCEQVLTPNGGQKDRPTDQEALQEALIKAEEGSSVCLRKGTYTFTSELSIDKKGLKLIGASEADTILEFGGQTVGANGIQIMSDGVSVESFTVKNTPGDGIRASAVENIRYFHVRVLWDKPASVDNGAYGLYPVSSQGVIIEGCVVSGARDAGIYVGQSTRVLITDSEAYGNVAGMELENTSEAEVVNCRAHDNTAGLLIFNLPDLPVQGGKHALVHDCTFDNNNTDNFAEPGTVVAKVVRGSGMYILSSDANEIRDNKITGNESTGLLIISYNAPIFSNEPKDPKFDRYPESNFIHDNTFAENGTNPYPTLAALVAARPVPDVIWDGCSDAAKDNSGGALTNCLMNNGSVTYANVNFCTMMAESKDIKPVTCEHPALVPQKP